MVDREESELIQDRFTDHAVPYAAPTVLREARWAGIQIFKEEEVPVVPEGPPRCHPVIVVMDIMVAQVGYQSKHIQQELFPAQ